MRLRTTRGGAQTITALDRWMLMRRRLSGHGAVPRPRNSRSEAMRPRRPTLPGTGDDRRPLVAVVTGGGLTAAQDSHRGHRSTVRILRPGGSSRSSSAARRQAGRSGRSTLGTGARAQVRRHRRVREGCRRYKVCFSNAGVNNPWRVVGWTTMQAEVEMQPAARSPISCRRRRGVTKEADHRHPGSARSELQHSHRLAEHDSRADAGRRAGV